MGLGCVLTDVRMPEIDGLALLRRLREQGVHLPVIVMTGQGDIAIAVQAMKAGAIDFLEKPFDDESLIEAVGKAQKQSERLREVAATSAEAASRLATLTPREREVFDLLVTGLPNKAIANTLGASPRTIEVHRARVFEKLRAHSLPDLVRLLLAAEVPTGLIGSAAPVSAAGTRSPGTVKDRRRRSSAGRLPPAASPARSQCPSCAARATIAGEGEPVISKIGMAAPSSRSLAPVPTRSFPACADR